MTTLPVVELAPALMALATPPAPPALPAPPTPAPPAPPAPPAASALLNSSPSKSSFPVAVASTAWPSSSVLPVSLPCAPKSSSSSIQ